MTTPKPLPPLGIIMGAASVRAILAGRKTETRRLVVPGRANPYPVGRVLWVRETILRYQLRFHGEDAGDANPHRAVYAADLTPVIGHGAPEMWCGRMVWQWPKLAVLARIPRYAARLWLRVTAERAEPLHAITEAGALAEGVTLRGVWYDYGVDWQGDGASQDPRTAYAVAWDDLHGRGAWEQGGDVRVVTFEVIEKPEAMNGDN